MKLLFLSVDDVLNSVRFFGDGRIKGSWPDAYVDPDAVERLNVICERTGCSIVLSCAWRQLLGIERVEKLLARRGGRNLRVAMQTQWLPGLDGFDKPRSLEIATTLERIRSAAWRSATPTHHVAYAILDADPKVGIHHAWHFVQTNPVTGLLDHHVAKVVEILSS